jgi:hypothetical protein
MTAPTSASAAGPASPGELATLQADVTIAFGLGWHVDELSQPDVRINRYKSDGLPSIRELEQASLNQLSYAQIDVALAQLRPRLDAVRLTVPSTENARKAASHTHSAMLEQLHYDILVTLTAADFRLGKAYELGCELASLCRRAPDAPTQADRERYSDELDRAGRWCEALTSVLPAHAGHAVQRSIERWRGRILAGRPMYALRAQGELWRALLSGEKQGKDMLAVSHYVAAAERLLVSFRSIARRFLRRFWLAALLVFALFALGLASILLLSRNGSTVAGIGAIVASLGLTWKGVGSSLGNLAGHVESPLWEAEIDSAIVEAITLEATPAPEPPPRLVEPEASAPAAGEPSPAVAQPAV